MPSSIPAMNTRRGLFGGSFDPIHEGHLAAARAAQGSFDLDEVLFMPAAQPPHKLGVGLAPGAHRLEMIRLAIAGEPTWAVSDLELQREGPSFTLDTVRALGGDLWLLIGADNLRGLGTWKGIEELLARTHPVIMRREGEPESLPLELIEGLSESAIERLRAGMLDLSPVPGRSTSAREQLHSGIALPEHVPEAVVQYIHAHGLYGSQS